MITQEKSSTPTRLLWNTNKAAVSLFWNTIMAAVTCENSIYLIAETLSENGKKIAFYGLTCMIMSKLETMMPVWDNSRDAADNQCRGATGPLKEPSNENILLVRLVRIKEIIIRYVEIFFQIRIARSFGLPVFEREGWNVGS